MKQFILIILVSIVNLTVNAQFYTQFDFGYSVYAESMKYTQFNNCECYYNLNTDKYDERSKVVGLDENEIPKGFFIDNEIGYRLNKRFGFSLNTYYFNNQLYKSTNNEITHIYHGYTVDNNNDSAIVTTLRVYNFYSSHLSFTPQVSVYFNINKFSYVVSLGYTMSFIKFFENMEETITNNTSDFYNNNKHDYEHYGKITHLFTIRNSFIYNINKQILLLASVSYAPAHLNYDHTYQTYYKLETSPYIINEEDTEVRNTDHYYPYDRFYSKLNFSFGIRYYFNKKNTENETN